MKQKWITGLALLTSASLLAFTLKKDIKPKPAETPKLKILKYNNPGLVVDLGVGLWAWPVPVDWDGDGDMDMLVSCPDKPFNGVWFFENKSGDKIPVFEKPVRLGPAVKNIQISYTNNGKARYTTPGIELANFTKDLGKKKTKLFPSEEILKDLKGRNRFNQWKFVDIDNDGDDDIVVGIDDWGDYGWDNAFDKNGNWTKGPLRGFLYLIENNNGKYENKGRIQADGLDIDVYGAPSPNFADFDGDGDLDIICGEFLDKMTYFENIGTKEKPKFAKGKYLIDEAGAVIKMDLEMILPTAVDWNQDGHVDLVVGDEDGRVALIENTGKKKNGMPLFKKPYYFKQKADNVKFGALATPVGVDWDNDGNQDIVVGNSAGHIAFIKNLGMNGETPKFAAPQLLKSDGKTIRIQAGENGSIQGPAEAKWGYTTIAVADCDGDGLKDLVINSIFGEVMWYKNIGTAKAPKLGKAQNIKVKWEANAAAHKPSWNWWNPKPNTLVTQWRTTPFVVDWNKDKLNDIVMLDTGGYLTYFERFKQGKELWLKPGKRIFYGTKFSGYSQKHAVIDSIPNLLKLNTGKAGQSGRRKFTIVDWDGDGKLDVLVNSNNATLLRNTGSKKNVVQLSDEGTLDALNLAGHDTSPTTVDWNKDGVPDLLIGAEDGHFYYMLNPRAKKK
ncbi:FG-GAP repeat domain-containing protein [Pedobacter sp.]